MKKNFYVCVLICILLLTAGLDYVKQFEKIFLQAFAVGKTQFLSDILKFPDSAFHKMSPLKFYGQQHDTQQNEQQCGSLESDAEVTEKP